MELKREVLSSQFLDPRRDFQPTTGSVEVRWDPLTGRASRLVQGSNLLPTSNFDLAALAEETRGSCFFCPERVEQVTPTLPPELHPDGRIRRGRALLFPNIVTYAQYSAVSVYSPDLHFIPLEHMTPRLLADNLATQVEFAGTVMRHDGRAQWASINANHMLPSGSSLFHPHIQSSIDPFPSTVQRLLVEVGGGQFEDYLATEQRLGERYLGGTGRVAWLASFAPLGFNEVRALVPGLCSPAEMDDELVEELGAGIAAALNLYAELGQQSFNLAVYGAPLRTDGYMLTLSLICRSNVEPLYRADGTYFERLHWQAMVDSTPEALAERGRGRFGR